MMRIGILTFHSQLNYGGILQCLALRMTLERMGHDVVVVDRIFLNQVRSVRSVFKGWGVVRFAKWAVKCLLRRKPALMTLRELRTVCFVKRHLPLTEYAFKVWNEAPTNLGLDLIVVGSDQVWNGTWQDPGPYLLEGAPSVPVIGYGISLGMTSIPDVYREKYLVAGKRFATVSVREREAADVLKDVGISAVCVADPVLLTDWSRYQTKRCVGLCCYFLSAENVSPDVIKRLEDFSRMTGKPVSLLVHGAAYWVDVETRLVQVKYAAGPDEFVREMAAAQFVISDSFHALMFSSIFQKNVRIIRPSAENQIRVAMFARIEEFVSKYVTGSCIVDSAAEAIESLSSHELVWNTTAIEKFADDSRDWLKAQLGKPCDF